MTTYRPLVLVSGVFSQLPQDSEIVTSGNATSTGGTVSVVQTGTGLTGGPIVVSGAVNLEDTAVTPGSYNAANISVDAQGRLTAASAGAINDLSDVTITTIASNQLLQYNGSAWVNVNANSVAGTVTSITAGDGLNGGTITGAGTISLSGTGVAAGQQLAASLSFNNLGQVIGVSGSQLNDLTNVAGAASDLQVLQFNGTTWGPATIPGATSSGITLQAVTDAGSSTTNGISVSGSSTFADNINCGNNVGIPDPTERGISLTPGGELYLSRPNDSGLIYGYKTGEAGVKFQLNNDGSSTFGSNLAEIYALGGCRFGPSYNNFYVSSAGVNDGSSPMSVTLNGRPGTSTSNTAFLIQSFENTGETGAQKVVIDWRGSATFANDVFAGGDPDNGATQGVRVSYGGNVIVSRDLGVNPVWKAYTTGDSTATSSINADGSSTFASTFRVNSSSNLGSDQLIRLGNANNSGNASAHLFTAGGYYVAPNNIDGTGANVSILDTGNATFAGVVSAGNLDFSSTTDTGTEVHPQGILKVQRLASVATNAEFFDCYYGNQNTVRFEVTGKATFASTVTAKNTSPVGNVFTGYYSGSDPNLLTFEVDANGNINVGAGGKVDITLDDPAACGAQVGSLSNGGNFISQYTSTAGAFSQAFAAYRGSINTVSILATGSATFVGAVQAPTIKPTNFIDLSLLPILT